MQYLHTHTTPCVLLWIITKSSVGGWLSLMRLARKPLKLPKEHLSALLWTWPPHASAVIDREAAGTSFGQEKEMLAIFVALVSRFNLCLDQHLA